VRDPFTSREATQVKADGRLRVFFSYFGGKYMRALHYPAPVHRTIVEPFAGAAGYSVRHHERQVILYDTSPYIAGVWRYLLHASSFDIRRLPLVQPGDDVQSLKIPQEARWLIGFWINQGSSVPKRTVGGRQSNKRAGHYATWAEPARERLAWQVDQIRHWRFVEGDCRDAPNVEATWFIDPPYEKHPYYPDKIDSYVTLANWCRGRNGQVIVCETEGATWLPFKPITTVAGTLHRGTTEVVWFSGQQALPFPCVTPTQSERQPR